MPLPAHAGDPSREDRTLSTDRPHAERAPYLTPATRDEIDAFEASVAGEVGRVRPCSLDLADGYCHTHRMTCNLAAESIALDAVWTEGPIGGRF